jgi:plastocyanin
MSPKTGCCEPDPNTPSRAAGLNVFDSRAIGRASCFAQRFMRSGVYDYAVVPGHGHALAAEFPFRVVVDEEKGREMTQHDVLVKDAKRGFDVDPQEVRINTGDLVLWSGAGRTTAVFSVVGEQGFFNSARMMNECGYSHAFGTAGEYRWIDAYGSHIGGVVRVGDPKSDDPQAFAKWKRTLGDGELVMIQDGKVDRKEIDIVTGQTVFFAVVTGPGISITDARLLNIGNAPSTNAKKAP